MSEQPQGKASARPPKNKKNLKKFTPEERMAYKIEKAKRPDTRVTRATNDLSFRILDMQGQLDGAWEKFQKMSCAVFGTNQRSVDHERTGMIIERIEGLLSEMNDITGTLHKVVGYSYRKPRGLPKFKRIEEWMPKGQATASASNSALGGNGKAKDIPESFAKAMEGSEPSQAPSA